MKKLICFVFILTSSLLIVAQNLIPFPKEYSQKSTKCHRIVNIVYSNNSYLDSSSSEAYSIVVKKGKINISGNKVWAMQTLKQLISSDSLLPDIEIKDWPSYPFRGFMHDVGRNFQSVEMLKKSIDLMSFYKFNYFHFHITDYPAWRIECKVFPQLNDPQYQRKGRDEGSFYTYDQIRELFAYAKERGITIVPEIDMPGHSTYFKNAFGFSMDSDSGMMILEKCLDEFFNEIPTEICPYFHIGSDEIHIADSEGFMKWIEDFVSRYQRKIIAWDPGLPASEKVIRQIWNEAAGSNAAAANKKGKYIDSFVGYLNYYDPFVFTNRAFLHTACAQNIPDTNSAMGGILCLWNDVNVDDKKNIALHSGMANGMMAFAERFWNGGNAGYVKNPNVLPNPNSDAGKALANFEKKIDFHCKYLIDFPVIWQPNASTEWMISLPAKCGSDSSQMKWIKAWGGAVDMDALCAENNVEMLDSMDCWAKTKMYSAVDTVVYAWIGFDAPARSNRISDGIGQQNKWESKGRAFVNGIEIFPAKKWNEPGKYSYHFNTWHRPQEEEPYTDEQFYWMRKPVAINLHKGFNEILLFTPRVFKGQRWSFGFIITDKK